MNTSEAEGDNGATEEPPQSGYPELWENLRADLKKPKTYFAIFVGIGLFVFMCLAAWQSCETNHLVTILQREFDVSQRPYVGVNHISRSFSKKLPNGQEVVVDSPDSDTHGLNFTIEVKNFGPAPGVNYYSDWSVFVGGVKEKELSAQPNSPFTLFPDESSYLSGQIGPDDYAEVMNGSKKLIIRMIIHYDGVASNYEECNQYQFRPDTKIFIALGQCDW
ncbi:MAG: hypothetical protein WAU58_18400 [Terriglobales bacterium]|jgi:hypothetical protein